MRELSAFADESGDSSHHSKYYLLTLVFHDQGIPLAGNIAKYEELLHVAGLPDIPFHMGPLLNGHGDYEHLTLDERRQLLVRFFTFVRLAPIRYKTFAYRKSETPPDRLMTRMKQDLINYLFANIEFFQGFDSVKVYYDRGQKLITKNLIAAMNYVLATNASEFKDGSPTDYRLSQAADLLCSIELAAIKFDAHEQTVTDSIFFHDARTLKQNYLKRVRQKLLP
jgi:hypothetical protein